MWWRTVAADHEAIDEAHGDTEHRSARAMSVTRTTRELRLRPAAAAGDRTGAGDASRRCCCSTNRRPACRADEGSELFEVDRQPVADITVLFIEHDMEVVFRFASRVTYMVGGRLLARGHARGDRRRPAGARGLSWRSASWPDTLLRTRRRACRLRRVGRARRCLASNWPRAAASRCSAATASARSTLLLTIMGFTRVASGAHALARSRHRPDRAASPRAHGHWLGAAGTRDISVVDGRGEPDRRRAGRPMEVAGRVSSCFRGWRSGGATWATICPAASSRCWRSPAR